MNDVAKWYSKHTFSRLDINNKVAVSLVSDLLVTGDSITGYLPHIAGCMSSSHSGKAEHVFSNLQGRGIFFITLCHVTFIYLTIILVHLKRFIYQRIIFSEIKDKRKTIVHTWVIQGYLKSRLLIPTSLEIVDQINCKMEKMK